MPRFRWISRQCRGCVSPHLPPWRARAASVSADGNNTMRLSARRCRPGNESAAKVFGRARSWLSAPHFKARQALGCTARGCRLSSLGQSEPASDISRTQKTTGPGRLDVRQPLLNPDCTAGTAISSKSLRWSVECSRRSQPGLLAHPRRHDPDRLDAWREGRTASADLLSMRALMQTGYLNFPRTRDGRIVSHTPPLAGLASWRGLAGLTRSSTSSRGSTTCKCKCKRASPGSIPFASITRLNNHWIMTRKVDLSSSGSPSWRACPRRSSTSPGFSLPWSDSYTPSITPNRSST